MPFSSSLNDEGCTGDGRNAACDYFSFQKAEMLDLMFTADIYAF